MTFLPIVVRELRVAARKRRTFWLRVVAALVAMIIGSCILLLSTIGAIPASALGGALFGILTWMALFAALAAGLFFTADCLSEEKREGTLGFLFLTDLRGYDVAGGKLLATSLRAFFALLAFFPILALTLTMGGVTGASFWKTSLALTNALFCSLMAGIFVSSISRDSQKALTGTLFLVLFWLIGGPILDAVLAWQRGQGSAPLYILSSPFYAFSSAQAWGRSSYWTCILVTQAVAWILFALASFMVKRTWQDKRGSTRSSASTVGYAWRYGARGRRSVLREKLISRNPVMWLACRERWQTISLWIVVILLALPVIAMYVLGFSDFAPALWQWVGGLCVWILYLWASSQSNRFFIEARRSGMIQLILSTPLSVAEIIRGQWQALCRMFGLPVLLVLGLSFFGEFIGLAFPPASSFQRFAHAHGPDLVFSLATTAIQALSAFANLAALTWFGMWMGMTSKNYSLATLKTFGFVQVIPAMVIWLASVLVVPLVILPWLLQALLASGKSGGANSLQTPYLPFFVIAAVAALLTLSKDAAFLFWARRRLYISLRQQASGGLSPLLPVAYLGAVPPPIPMPPPIPTRP